MADTIQSLINGILQSKETIVGKVKDMGKCTSDASLALAATGLDSITIHNAKTIAVPHGESVTLEEGYYKAGTSLSGTNGTADTGTMIPVLDVLSVTPNDSVQTFTANENTNSNGLTLTGYSVVTVDKIPENYVNKTSSTYANVDATDADVLSGKKFINKSFNVVAGTMPNNGTITTLTLSGSRTSYTIPQGYHSGSGKIQISTQTKTDSVTTGSVTVNADSGKVLTSVTVTGPSASTTTTDQTIDGLDETTYTKTVNSGYLASDKKVTFDPTSIINELKAI